MRATDGTIRYASLVDQRLHWSAWVVMVSIGLVSIVGMFLLERRMVGALVDPLRVVPLLFIAVVVTAAAYMLCVWLEHSNLSLSLAAGLLVVFAVACSYPGSRILDWFTWIGAAAAAFAAPIYVRLHPTTEPAPASIRVIEPETEIESGEQILQNLTRLRTAEGHDAIRGTMVCEFATGERQTTLHVAFCPPFERMPDVEANVADDSDATIKLTQAFHHGVEFEIRLPQAAAGNGRVEIEVFATDAESE